MLTLLTVTNILIFGKITTSDGGQDTLNHLLPKDKFLSDIGLDEKYPQQLFHGWIPLCQIAEQPFVGDAPLPTNLVMVTQQIIQIVQHHQERRCRVGLQPLLRLGEEIVTGKVSTQPQAATHWLVRDLFKLTAEASASHLSSYQESWISS
jgi:hypothetical protein